MLGPWSGPSMFLSTAAFPLCLKTDFFTITFLIKAGAGFLQDRSPSVGMTSISRRTRSRSKWQSSVNSQVVQVKVKPEGGATLRLPPPTAASQPGPVRIRTAKGKV